MWPFTRKKKAEKAKPRPLSLVQEPVARWSTPARPSEPYDPMRDVANPISPISPLNPIFSDTYSYGSADSSAACDSTSSADSGSSSSSCGGSD